MSAAKTNRPLRSPDFQKRYYLVPRHEIAYLRFIMESYDGLLFMRTLDKQTGLVEVAYPPTRAEDAEGLLAALADEAGMQPVPVPDEVAPL